MKFNCVLIAMISFICACSCALETPGTVWKEREIATDQATLLPAGPVWLRAWLKVPDNMAGNSGRDLWRDSMSLTLQNLPGPIAVFLNGQKIIDARDIPADEPRRFKVPKGIFEKGAYNAFVIKLDGALATRGLTVAPVFAGYFDEVKMERAWLMTVRPPSDADLKAITTVPAVAAYSEKDFHPAMTPMQASLQPVRGQFVAP